MSKSRGTFINARTYLNHLDPEYLRYYFAAKLGPHVEDLDLNLEDFVARINSDLVGKYVNIASRTAGFITSRFAGQLWNPRQVPGLLAIRDRLKDIADAYEARRFGDAVREIMGIADIANQYFDQHKPWELAKDKNKETELHSVCTHCLNIFYLISIAVAPILPGLARRVAREFFGMDRDFLWTDLDTVPARIYPYQHLATRVDPKQVEAMLDESKEDLKMTTPAQPTAVAAGQEPIKPEVSIDDFAKVDLRIARIVAAAYVEGADKLLQLTVDLGEGRTRNIFAGIRSAYDPKTLEGRLTVVVANLAPRKMKFGVSEGMVLAAGPGGKDLWILAPDSGAQPGMRVK
jgi:methionyl-tRNA synthetase